MPTQLLNLFIVVFTSFFVMVAGSQIIQDMNLTPSSEALVRVGALGLTIALPLRWSIDIIEQWPQRT